MKQRRLCNCLVEEKVGFFVYVCENKNVGVDFFWVWVDKDDYSIDYYAFGDDDYMNMIFD